jgi:hypothetical protein
MKKVLLTTALLVATAAGVSANGFNGGYASANLGYASTQAKLQTNARATKRGYNQSGVATFVKAGYGEHCGSVYMGGEVKGGYVFSNKKNGPDKLTRKWNGGIAGRVGACIEHNLLGYFRLGLDYDTYTYKYAGGSSSKGLNTWSLTPGVGMDWKVAHNTFVTAGVDYGFAFKVSKPSGTIVNTKPKTLTILVGAGYQF